MKHEHEQQWNDEDDEQPTNVEQVADSHFNIKDYALDYVLDEGLVEFGAGEVKK